MSWTCPNCGRTFHNRGQPHSCASYPPEIHLAKGTDSIRALYEELHRRIETFGPFERHANRSEILYRKTAVFLGVRVFKTKLSLIFYLDHPDTDPPVITVNDVSKNRVIHQVDIHNVGEINDRLLFLLAKSYDTVD